jgi:hypothetical protein
VLDQHFTSTEQSHLMQAISIANNHGANGKRILPNQMLPWQVDGPVDIASLLVTLVLSSCNDVQITEGTAVADLFSELMSLPF